MKKDQSGFGVIETLIVGMVIIAIAVVGFVVFKHNNKTSAVTPITQTLTKKSKSTSGPAQSTIYIKPWGVEIPLSDGIKDAYYTVTGSNTDANGLPNTAWLSLTSLNAAGCDISTTGPTATATPVGSIIRALPTATDPVSGDLYTKEYPGGVMINDYYYGYAPWKSSTCVSAATLQAIDAAFLAALQKATIVAAD